jgi:hypothetical protein
MALSRKDALKRLRGLAPAVEKHLAKVASNPGHSSLAHWKTEIRQWLLQMEDSLPHVGKKTAAEWKARLETYKAALEE